MARKLSPRTLLHRLLANASTPVYALDGSRRIVFCNQACTVWTGADEDTLLGIRCDYHSDPNAPDHIQIAAALCPPPEVFLGHPTRAEIRLPPPTPQTRWAEFLPLGESLEEADPSESAGVLVWLEPIANSPASSFNAAPHPWQPEELHACLQELRRDERQRHAPQQLIGTGAAMVRVRRQLELATGAKRVLISGPPGSGREHVARVIHHARIASESSLIPLNCGLLDAELLETTVLAFMRQTAELEAETSSTLLLLDVEQMSAESQLALHGIMSIDELTLATIATSRSGLRHLATQESFRTDLAFALCTLEIELPALCDRREDIPLLAQMFLEGRNADGGSQLSGFEDEALERMVAYNWPDNLDELAEVVAEACQGATGPWLTADDLPNRLHHAERATARAIRSPEAINMDAYLERIERELMRRAMTQAKGNKTKAAQLLGLNRARFHRRLAQLGLAD